MTTKSLLLALGAAALAIAVTGAVQEVQGANPDPETARLIRGSQISPVHLNVKGKDRNLVNLGSYIVNAQAGCNDCHTEPSFAPGGDPYVGEPIRINADRFLAGGRSFGPVVSANITPDADGKPAGLTFDEFRTVMRTGHDPDDEGILQVMPWPIFRNMTDRDLRAVYLYLTSIPHRDD